MGVEFWILISLLFSAIFSGIEIAFVSSDKLQVELDNKKGGNVSRIVSFFARQPSRFIATLLLGNNVAIVVYTIYMEKWLDSEFEMSIGLKLLVSTLVVLFFAEYIPKAIFRINSNKVLRIFAYPLLIIYYSLIVIVYGIIHLSKIILNRLFGVKLEEDELIFGKTELDQFFKRSIEKSEENEEIDTEVHFFHKALDYSNVKVRDCMVPRTEVVGLEEKDDIEILRQKFIETGFSKLLIYREDLDNIIGYVHSFEMFKRPDKILTILRPIFVVPETMAVEDLMAKFTQKRRSIAVVVDEFGGTAGIVTVEDVMEEIFGEILDEHDVENETEIRESSIEYLFSGKLEITYLNEKYGFNLPESEEYETLAGLIITQFEAIPEEKYTYDLEEGYRLGVEEVKGSRIELIRLFVTDRD